MACYHSSSDRELAASAKYYLPSSYPSPVPEDRQGCLDANLSDATGWLSQGQHQIQDVSAVESGCFGVSGRGGFGAGFNTHLSFARGTPDTSPLPQLHSPDYTVAQSPSMASEMLYDGICSPPPAPDSVLMYPVMNAVDPRQQSNTLHQLGCHEYVNPAEMAPGASYRYSRQSAPAADGGFQHLQSHPQGNASTLPYREDSTSHESMSPFARNIQNSRPSFMALDYGHDGPPHHSLASPQGRAEAWQPVVSQRSSRVQPSWEGPVPITRSPPEKPITCPECNYAFDSKEKLNEHMRSEACKPFACLLQFAGCKTKCRNKNEWKRHLNSIHVQHECYICDCTKAECAGYIIHSALPGRPLPPAFPSFGKIFNRKDLYKEHRGREEDKRLSSDNGGIKKRSPRAPLDKMAERALHHRIELPTYMQCFVEGCGEGYKGRLAWNDYLEHAAVHVKEASGPGGQPVAPRGLEDVMLTDFGEKAGFLAKTASGWRLVEPLEGIKPDSKKTGTVKVHKQEGLRGRKTRR